MPCSVEPNWWNGLCFHYQCPAECNSGPTCRTSPEFQAPEPRKSETGYYQSEDGTITWLPDKPLQRRGKDSFGRNR
jgi:hypothetical protein